jgi:hypothetical protein
MDGCMMRPSARCNLVKVIDDALVFGLSVRHNTNDWRYYAAIKEIT